LLRLRSVRNPRPLPSGIRPAYSAVSAPGLPCFPSDSVIRSDFPCNDDVTGGCSQRGPSISAGPGGSFVVSWYEFRDGDADAWYQRFDSSGMPMGSNQRLNSDSSMGWQGDPASSMGPGGEFLFTWEDRREIGNSDVYCQRFDASGRPLGTNFRVSDSGVSGDQSISDAATGGTGITLATWDDRRFGITGDIFAQFLNPDGSPMDTNFRVNDDQVGYANQYEPAASTDDTGRFVVAWMDGRGLNPYDWNVFCQRFHPDGSRAGSNIQVTTNDSIQWAPGVGMSASGGFAVCWDDHREGEQTDVHVRVYDVAGQPRGTAFRVNDEVQGDQYAASAAGNESGEFIVVWSDRRHGNTDVYAQRLSSDGSPLGGNFLVNDDGGAKDQAYPDAAALPDGGWVVIWVDSRMGDQDIYGQRLERSGLPVGANFRVNDDTASSLQRVSSMAMDDRGRILVAWEDERSGGTDIYRCLLDETGGALGSNLRLNDDPGESPQYYAAAAAGKNRSLVTWTDGRSGYDTYGQFLDGSGQPVGSNVRINSDPGDAHQWYSYCAMDTSDRAVVIWMDTRETDGYRVFCRRYAPDGTPVGSEFPVSDDSANQYYASCDMSADGRFVVAWMDYRSGNSDIYCQAFRADGSRVGENVRVDADTGSSYQGYPACAMADDGSFAVAWEETRNDRYDVYLQWFDSSAVPVGGNSRVNDGGGEGDCYSPTCAFDRQGRLAVVFNDERTLPGSPQIFCQRFRSDRTPVSGNQMVSEPSLFPKNHHWTVGQSVAVSDAVVACAWTDNRRHRGWDIFAKLMDWELVGIAGRRPVMPDNAVRLVPSVAAAGRFRLTGLAVGSGAQVSIYDASGRRLEDISLGCGEGALRLEKLGPGVYYAVVRGEDVDFKQKLVVGE